MLGLAQGAFDKAVPYTYERKQFGQAVGTFQGMQFQIAEAAIKLESARLLTYNAARRKEEGKSFTKEAAMAKYWASQVAQQVSGSAIEWAGGVGFTRETGIEKFWRDSKIVSCSSCMWLQISDGFLRVRFTRGRQTFSYKQLPSSFRRSIHNNPCTCIILTMIAFSHRVKIFNDSAILMYEQGFTLQYARVGIVSCSDRLRSHKQQHALKNHPSNSRAQNFPRYAKRDSVEES